MGAESLSRHSGGSRTKSGGGPYVAHRGLVGVSRARPWAGDEGVEMRFAKTVLFDMTDGALSWQMRRRRFSLFRSLVDALPRPIRILDLGGTQQFWDRVAPSEDSGIDV